MSQPAQLPLFAPDPTPTAAGPGRTGATPRAAVRIRPPALRVCVLGSGSGGNCTVLHLDRGALLIDAGFGPHTTRRRLAQAGLALEDVRAICLTHLDQDHFRATWPATLRKLGIPIWCHHWHRDDLHRLPGGRELDDAGLVHTFDGAPFEPMAGAGAGTGVVVSTYRCQHDLQGTISYRITTPLGVVGHATDLGHAPPALIEHLSNVDLLAIECNYDEHMTIHSSRPTFVNRRNMSDSGHLSNEQAFEAVSQIDRASGGRNPRHVVLLHRSSQCNHPTKIKRVFARDPRLARRITLTEQRRRTRWITVRPVAATVRHQLPLM